MLLPFVFGKGLLLGLAIAAPVGPIGILCIRRTLTQGRLIGFISGCGAATADAFYGTIAAFGLTALSTTLDTYTTLIQLLGGLFLCYLGLKIFLSKPLTPPVDLTNPLPNNPANQTQLSPFPIPDLLSAYTTTLTLTLTNPATILSFLAIFTGLGITQGDYLRSVTLVSGVFSGSLLWWLVLVSGVAYLRSRLTLKRLAQFNSFSSKVFGLIILAFGFIALAASVRF